MQAIQKKDLLDHNLYIHATDLLSGEKISIQIKEPVAVIILTSIEYEHYNTIVDIEAMPNRLLLVNDTCLNFIHPSIKTAIQRRDLPDVAGIPAKDIISGREFFLNITKPLFSLQPEALTNDEYNVIVDTGKKGEIVTVGSIDLDWI